MLFNVLCYFVTNVKKVLGAGNVGEQQNVGLGKFGVHEARQHVLAEHGGIIVDGHPDFETLLRQDIMFVLELIEGIIDQL